MVDVASYRRWSLSLRMSSPVLLTPVYGCGDTTPTTGPNWPTSRYRRRLVVIDMHAGDPPPGVNDHLGQVVLLHLHVEQSAHTHTEPSPSCRSISSQNPTACSSRLVM